MSFSTPRTAQYLTFDIADERYAVPILRVHGIIEYTGVTPVPGSAAFVKGVFNHGGVVTPVIDLAARLGLGHTTITRRTCFILVGAAYEGGEIPIGLMVDRVKDVIDVDSEAIQPAPDFGTRIRLDYLEGLLRSDNAFTMLLSIDRFLTAEELLEVHGHARAENLAAS